jgi:hypothetical protein
MTALLLRHRLGEPAQESVEDGAGLKKIAESAEIVEINSGSR